MHGRILKQLYVVHFFFWRKLYVHVMQRIIYVMLTFVEPFSRLMKLCCSQMDFTTIVVNTLHSYNYFLRQSYWYLKVLTFTSEQSKGIVLYSQRNCRQESGTCIGIPLSMFLISIVIHISRATCVILLNSFWQIRTLSSEADEPLPWSSWSWYTAW